jgi:hypothetical protein
LLAPPGSFVTDNERQFIIRINGAAAQRIPLTRGAMAGDLTVLRGTGALRESDRVL